VSFRSDASFPEPVQWNGEDYDMPRCKVHHHPCQDCGAKTECGGVFEQNYDGWPEVICDEFNMYSGPNMDFICDACHDKREADADTAR
jgi:hypothetical protein